MAADAVHYTEDTGRTAAEKAQARANIGAADDADVTPLHSIVSGQQRQITALKNLLDGVAYSTEEDSTAAYSKTVPSGAQAVSVNSFGGNSVAWNQQVINGDFSNGKENWKATGRGTSITVESGILTASGASENWGGAVQNVRKQAGHSYALFVNAKSNTQNTLEIATGFFGAVKTIGMAGNSFSELILIASADVDASFTLNIANHYTTDSFSIQHAFLIDLTKMFGAGNEPATTADPRIAMIEAYLAEHPEYNDGEIISAEVTEIVSKKQDNTVLGTLAIPPALLSFLADKGYGRSAGDVHNEVDFENKKYIQRVGSAELTDFIWGYDQRLELFTASITGAKGSGNASIAANLLCAVYTASGSADSIIKSTDMRIALTSPGTTIRVYNQSYTDVAAFIAAMSGIILYYELAEPVEYDISAYLPEGEGYNLLLTEPGGALTFKQADDTELSVPQDLTWAVQQSGGGGGGGTWGSITGTLANQTDLKNALDGKADKPTIKTTMDAVATVNTQYYLGTVTSVSITMPTAGISVGDEILVVFSSGATAATLTCNLTGFSFTTKANMTSWLKFTCYDATNGDWLVETKEG